MVPGTGIWHTHDVAYIRLPDPLRPSLLNARALFRKTLTRSSRRRMEISQNTMKTAPGEVSAGQTGSKMVSIRCAKGVGGWVGGRGGTCCCCGGMALVRSSWLLRRWCCFYLQCTIDAGIELLIIFLYVQGVRRSLYSEV